MVDGSYPVTHIHRRSEIHLDLEYARFWSQEVIVSIQGLGENRRRLSKTMARGLGPLEYADMDQDVSQSRLCNPMNTGRNSFTPTEFRCNDDLPLVLRLDREQP